MVQEVEKQLIFSLFGFLKNFSNFLIWKNRGKGQQKYIFIKYTHSGTLGKTLVFLSYVGW